MNRTTNTTLESAFFSLLRAGLWENHTPDPTLFNEDTNWETLFEIARQQTVVGIVWDGIAKLPPALQPPRNIKFNWYSFVLKLEQTNQLINENVVELIQLYQQNGLHPILLKGAGVATLYPNPLHRGCGDIDIYVGKADYKKANELAASIGFSMEHETLYHSGMQRGVIHLENHNKMINAFLPYMKQMFGEQLDAWYPHSSHTVSINGVDVPVSPIEFDVRYVFCHLYKHFMIGGVGLRQLCDWAVMLDKAKLKTMDIKGGIVAWQFLGLFLVDYLGLESAKLPYYNDRYLNKMLKAKQIIIEEGNFGAKSKSSRSERPQGYIAGKLHTLSYLASRWPKQLQLQPVEVFKYLFFYQFVSATKGILKGK